MYYLLLFLPFVMGFSKEFEAPVARHDADNCGVYLCPSLPDHATSYIQEGCYGDFKEWVSTIREKENMLFQEVSSVSQPFCVSPEILFILVIFSATLSFILGWREYSFQQKMNPVKIDQMD